MHRIPASIDDSGVNKGCQSNLQMQTQKSSSFQYWAYIRSSHQIDRAEALLLGIWPCRRRASARSFSDDHSFSENLDEKVCTCTKTVSCADGEVELFQCLLRFVRLIHPSPACRHDARSPPDELAAEGSGLVGMQSEQAHECTPLRKGKGSSPQSLGGRRTGERGVA